jgi:hypothetical protein
VKVVKSKSRNRLGDEKSGSCSKVATSHMRPDVDDGWQRNRAKLLAKILLFLNKSLCPKIILLFFVALE